MTNAGDRWENIIQALQRRQHSTFYSSGIAAILNRGAYRYRVRAAQTSVQFRLTAVLSEVTSTCAVVAAGEDEGSLGGGEHLDPSVCGLDSEPESSCIRQATSSRHYRRNRHSPSSEHPFEVNPDLSPAPFSGIVGVSSNFFPLAP